MSISIEDFDTEKSDNSSHVLVITIDSTGKLEETIRIDKKTNYVYRKWIQVGFFIKYTIGKYVNYESNICSNET